MTTPAEEAQSAARSARRRAERQSIRDGVIVEPAATPSAHLISLQRDAAASAAFEGETQTLEQPEPVEEPAPEATKATRSRKAAAK